MKNKLISRLTIVALVLSTILIITTGCGKNQEAEKTSDNIKEKTVIRVGYFPNITHAQALVGISDGTFKNALGNDVQIEERNFNAGPAEIEALLAGEIDLGYIGPVPAINGYVKSKGGLRVVAGAVDAGAVFVAGKGSNIKSVKDLDGKKVAIPQLGNTQDISLRNLLNQANLKDAAKGGTVTVIPAENPDILTLISKGDIDAALVPEPWGSRIVKQAGARVVLDYQDVWRDGKYTTAVIITSKKFLDEHPDLVEKWLTAHVDITEYIKKDQLASQKTINDQIKKLTGKSLPDDVLKSSFQRITVTYNPETESIKEFVKLSVDNGYIKETPDVSNMVDLTSLNQVLQKKGLPTVR